MIFTVSVDELVSTQRLYTIEADSEEEAILKAEAGDNLCELDLDNGEVIERNIVIDTILALP